MAEHANDEHEAEGEAEYDCQRPEAGTEERVREQPLLQQVGAGQQGRIGQIIGAQARPIGEQQRDGESHE